MRSKLSLILVLVILPIFGVQIQGSSNHLPKDSRYGTEAATVISNSAPAPFTCSCSCNGGESNCSGHCQIFGSCDTVSECFACVADCCRGNGGLDGSLRNRRPRPAKT